MNFISKEHEEFYFSQLVMCGFKDCYHKSLFYVLGIDEDTRAHINDLFDFKRDCIKPDSVNSDWLTSTTTRVVRLAFNLWNGFTEDEYEVRYTPYRLFQYIPYEYMQFFCIGILLSRDF